MESHLFITGVRKCENIGMKRIIKYGKYNRVTCTKCECEYTFDSVDVMIIDNKKIVVCPLCGEKNAPQIKE